MIDLPFNPDDLGGRILASYLRADPFRLRVLKGIIDHLDDDGRVGDAARFYVVENAFRRAVLRGVLIAEAIRLPSWAHETRQTSAANRDFVDRYREKYNRDRRDKRTRARQFNPTLSPSASQGHIPVRTYQ